MDPSHARKYENADIERIAANLLRQQYPQTITLPVEIDLIVERYELVDNIVPVELLEDKFKVAAVLTCKVGGRFDILVDQDTFDYQRARASFSIAHEFGHIVLHSQVCSHCTSIEDSVALMRRIRNAKAHDFIERNANYFAGAILIPQRTIKEDTAKIYEWLIKDGNYDTKMDLKQFYATLARRYEVNPEPMRIRLEQLSLTKNIRRSLFYKYPYLEL